MTHIRIDSSQRPIEPEHQELVPAPGEIDDVPLTKAISNLILLAIVARGRGQLRGLVLQLGAAAGKALGVDEGTE